ncbi:transcriptional repressor general negative regulator of transcription subunit 4 [Talaromyces marneffei ATCC 18224]
MYVKTSLSCLEYKTIDDEEFPPLNVRPKSRLEHAFRPTLTQESREHSRSGTPSLPPGLPLPHGHPPAAFFSDKKDLESPEFSISLPSHGPPGLPASRRGTPLQKSLDSVSRRQTPTVPDASDENVQVEKTRNFGDISLGSPKARSARKPNVTAPPEQPANSKPPVAKGSQSKKPKPIKLDLSMPLEELATASPVKESPASSSAVPANLAQSSVAANSRPGTPQTGISRNSDSSGPRQPRVLRLVDTPKTETPPPPSAVPSLSSVVQAKVRSRRPSVSSVDRPDTPGDVGSDFELTTSASVSRPNSPPPSKIGSAPVRAMTKNQAKKERRMKAKQAEEAIKEEVATAIAEEPVQAPILGRKRKTKKPPTTPSEPAASTKEPSDAENVATQKTEVNADVGIQKPKVSPEKVPDVSKPAPEVDAAEPSVDEPWRANNTIAQLIEDAKATGTSIKDLFLERTGPLHVLLAQMQSKGDIDLNSHPLFNPPPLNQRTDMKCEADDYEFFKLPLYISEENKKILLSGQPLRINHGVDNLKVRCMITPKGRVLRHLSDEEEDRYLELENHVDAGTWGEYPSTSVPGLDTTNMNGGLDALFLTPGRFGVALSEPPSPRMSLAAGGAVVSAEDQFALDPPSESGPTMGEADHPHKLPESARYPPIIPEMDNVFGMSNKELRTFIEQSQRELESSRKEFDAIDKKLAALVKRNKKLAQQALSSVVEVGK